MANDFLGTKGQLSVEFVLILVVILLYVSTLIQPKIVQFQGISEETFGLGYTSLAANKIVNAIDLVQLSGKDTVQTITIFVPENGYIICKGYGSVIPATDQNTITFKYTLTSKISPPTDATGASLCPLDTYYGDDTCVKKLVPQSGAGINCGVGFTNQQPAPNAQLLRVQITKTSSNPAEPVEIKLVQ
ncbi:MAG: hypothetical protein AABW85_05235 [archaeon]